MKNKLYHILLLGQSLSLGYESRDCLEPVEIPGVYMFRQVRTQDLGYGLGVSKEEYSKRSGEFDRLFYKKLLPLRETGGNGCPHTAWEEGSVVEYETPASGAAWGLESAYRQESGEGLPCPLLFSAPGISGTEIAQFSAGTRIYDRARADMENGRRLAGEHGWEYRVLAIFWLQGENNYTTPPEEYARVLLQVKEQYANLARQVTGQKTEPVFITYQSSAIHDFYDQVSQNPGLVQFEAAADRNNNIYMSAPCYQFSLREDNTHLTNVSSRNMGILLGRTLYEVLHGRYTHFKPSSVHTAMNRARLSFSFPVMLDPDGLRASHDRERTLSSSGFFCFDSSGRALDTEASLSAAGTEISLLCSGVISRIAYGYDPGETEYGQHTFGGTVCRAETIPGWDGPLRFYMPVQDIWIQKTTG